MKEFDLQSEIKKLEDSSRRDFNIIAMYLTERKPDLRTKEQFGVALRRHLRAASQLKPFFDDMKVAKRLTEAWTLETIIKVLTK